MSDEVYAELLLAPWNPEELASTKDGQALLDAINDWPFNETEEYSDHGTPMIRLEDYNASNGINAFIEDLGIITLLQPLTLWCELYEAGTADWDPSRSVLTPDGLLFKCPMSGIDRDPLLSRWHYNQIRGKGADVIDVYFDITSRSLGQWITGEPLRLGASSAQDAVYKTLINPMYELQSPSMSSERLAELAQSSDGSIRLMVAERAYLPETLVSQLAQDEWQIVRARVASRSDLPVQLFLELSRDESPEVRVGVAGNTSAPTSTLTLLTGDANERVVKIAHETLATQPRSTFEWGMGGC